VHNDNGGAKYSSRFCEVKSTQTRTPDAILYVDIGNNLRK